MKVNILNWYYRNNAAWVTHCSGNCRWQNPWVSEPPDQLDERDSGLKPLLMLCEIEMVEKAKKTTHRWWVEVSETAAETMTETDYREVCICSNSSVYLPDVASGQKMSIPPPSSAGTTQPQSFSQKSLCSVVSRVLSDRLLPVAVKVKQFGLANWKMIRFEGYVLKQGIMFTIMFHLRDSVSKICT